MISITQLIVWLIIGAIAGWLAGLLLKARSLGTLNNIMVGLLGALVGGILVNLLHITLPAVLSQSITIKLNDILIAFVGAVVVLLIVSFLRRRV